MKERIIIAALCLAVLRIGLITYHSLSHTHSVRIACVGDSITRGAFLEKRSEECYPARLKQMLGRGYIVKNFGVNSATAQKNGDNPYWEQKAFSKSFDWKPDIVILMLGTNDTKTQNRGDLDNFTRDYAALVDSYLSGSSKPELLLMTPPPVFTLDGEDTPRFGMNAQTLTGEITSIRQIARERGLTIIDLNAVLDGQSQYFQLDGVHPDRYGADIIAQTVYDALS